MYTKCVNILDDSIVCEDNSKYSLFGISEISSDGIEYIKNKILNMEILVKRINDKIMVYLDNENISINRQLVNEGLAVKCQETIQTLLY